jgi:2-keto-4-pentenoate hydratase/2-oxohepta-3-ene-1,7-dioic acid hydratase in catechol pathway
LFREKKRDHIPALLDYETELGFVLLEEIDISQLGNDNYALQSGFFMANDMSARSIAVMGEGQANRYDYWGVSKSFVGFTPYSDQIWVPSEFKSNAIPCTLIETVVNGEIRQHQSTSDLIYTPLQMLRAIQRKYPNNKLSKGDWVLTGTPGGVAMSTPRWLVRMANMVGMDRFGKFDAALRKEKDPNFLKPGDKVLVRGEGIGSVEVTITD